MAFVIEPHIQSALSQGLPVVALESTIISHGMPYPQNLETAHRVEDAIRKCGAVPATIAILDGALRVGLDERQLETLAKAGRACAKVSRRDIAITLAKGIPGATTVSGTMVGASMASGIDVFVTGGIGGVHRGAEDSMDVSADLIELGRTPVAVVCAGVKSILDIGRTLEYLETQGVPVLTLGQQEFPAFFTRHSGFKSPSVANSVDECARAIHFNKQLGLRNGLLIAVPVPEEEEAAAEVVESATKQALAEADEQRISGRDLTPFMLKRINELTSGASLKSNIALVLNNAVHGAKIAVALKSLSK